MQSKIIQIGKSKGLRLSKTILEKYNICDEVNLRLEKNYIVIEPIIKPRNSWDEKFKERHHNGDDELLMDDFFEEESSLE